jgi:ketosteroid isomerase-like protein
MFHMRGIRIMLPAAALSALALCAPAFATQTRARTHMPRGQKHSYEKEVEKLEAQWRQAQLDGDVQTMDRLLADDYIGITSTGLVVTKPEQLQRVRDRTVVLTRMDVSDVKVKLIGKTAIVTSRVNVEGANDGATVNGMYRYTRVYSRTASGGWKIVNFESTRIPAPGSLGNRPAREDMMQAR